MRYSLTLQHIQLSVEDRLQIEEKLSRIKRYVTPPWHIDIVVSRDTHHQQGDVIACRVNLRQGSTVFHAERAARSALTALDDCVEALQQELKKAKEKQRRTRRGWRTWFRRRV